MADFNWDDLRYFLHVARAGTLSAAARAMGVDHATMGRRIAALERSLGQTLFRRSLSGYALTVAGERWMATVEQMEELALRSAMDSGGGLLGGIVRVTTPDGFGNFFLAAQTAAFSRSYPRLRMQFVPMQQIHAQTQREGDLAVTLVPAGTRFVTEKLADYGLGLYAARGYFSDKQTPKTRHDLRDLPLVGYVEDLLVSSELDYLSEVLPGLRAAMQCSSLLGQVMATRNGAGLCILPHFVARQFDDLDGVLPDVVQLRRSYWLNASYEVAGAPKVRALAEFLRQAAGHFDFR